jgi:predicted Zn-dependent protease
VIVLCALTKACRTVGGAIAVQVGSDAASAQYSQQDESAADSAAVTITASAGYDPEGLPAFLRQILAARTGQPSPIEAFFSTHPTDQTRITALERQIAARSTASGPTLTRDTPEFGAMREHVKHLPPPPVDSTQQAATLRGGQ